MKDDKDILMNTLRILVADDSKIIRTKLAQMLTALGHTIAAEAETGEEAVTLYRQETPDLVTMDINMPGMGGIDATRAIIKTNPDATILMLTSHVQEDIIKEAIDAGAKGYVVKPVTKEKMAQRIQQIMEL